MSELAPLDILAKKFSKKLNGYAPLEVHEYLTEMAGTIEALIRDRGELRQKVHYLDQELSSFREREAALKGAMVAAERSAETTIEVARSEGQRIVDEGHGLAERLVEEANQRARNIESMINDLRNRRREARADLNRLVELLEGIVQDDQNREREERSTPQLALLHRRAQDNSEGQG
ncbi:MAG: DivIVA domain-containing protein [Thermoanaerobaculales bacterium]